MEIDVGQSAGEGMARARSRARARVRGSDEELFSCRTRARG